MAKIDQESIWSQRYRDAGEDYLFGIAPSRFLEAHKQFLNTGATALSVADGEGRNSVWLARRGLHVQAFDVADQGVAKARRLAAEQGVQVDYAVADCDGYAWPQGSCDGVAAIFVQFADPALRERLFAHIVASLRPGGTLVLQGYTPRQLVYRTGGPPLASHLYTADLLRRAFAELDILVLDEYEADLAEGTGHKGRSALIGLVARKRPGAAEAT